MYTVKLRSGETFDCEEHETIVQAALRNQVFLDHSCLSGRCSTCKLQVLEGEAVMTQEEIILTGEEKRNGYVLSCISRPRTDLTVDAEDLKGYGLSAVKTVPCKVNDLTLLTPEMIQVSLRLPPNQKPNFLEGQYLNVLRNGQKRSYSISNPSSAADFQLLIKKVENGVFSEYWFNEAKPNDLLRLEVPVGTFFLRNHQNMDTLVLVATGSGIAPIKAILQSPENVSRLKAFNRILVVWGLRNPEDVFWTPTEGVEFLPVFSRNQTPKKYVQDVLVDMSLDMNRTVVYACGMEEMINDLKNKLKGLPKNQFFADSFVKSS